MRRFLSSFVLLGFAITAGVAYGGQAWTDANGDGQPDQFVLQGDPGDQFAIDLWIDSQSFVYTSYNIWAEWDQYMTRIGGGTNQVSGCSNDPNDTFSHPRGIGFAGSVCNPAKHGVLRIGSFVLQMNFLFASVNPIIDQNNPYNVFSVLSSPSGYLLFQSQTGTHFNIDATFGTESKSWGEIKGLYR